MTTLLPKTSDNVPYRFFINGDLMYFDSGAAGPARGVYPRGVRHSAWRAGRVVTPSPQVPQVPRVPQVPDGQAWAEDS